MRCDQCEYEHPKHHSACPTHPDCTVQQREIRKKAFDHGYQDSSRGDDDQGGADPSYLLGYSLGIYADSDMNEHDPQHDLLSGEG